MEIDYYAEAMVYPRKRAKSGCAVKKKEMERELRIQISMVNHEIIMNRQNAKQDKESEGLKAARLELKTKFLEALKLVH